MRRLALRVHVTDGQGRRVPGSGLAAWLERQAPASGRGSVTIALVSDAVMRRLNRTFRGQNRVTDVLSFPVRPQAQGPGPKAFTLKGKGPRPKKTGGAARWSVRDNGAVGNLGPWALGLGPDLGDIAIATGRARRQARKLGHSTSTELRVLALHGLLHLLGYDHDADQGDMRRVEERLRRRAGLPGGLIGRAGGSPVASPRRTPAASRRKRR
jgi:probable rRNA maturation factor